MDRSFQQVTGVSLLSLRTMLLLAVGLTLAMLAFIAANGEVRGRIFWHLLTTQDQPAAWLMLAGLVFALAVNQASHGASWVENLLGWLERRRLWLAVAVGIGLCGASLFIYRDHPLSMDEYAAVFQARIFAAGAMHGQFPLELIDYLIPRGFQKHFLQANHHTGAVFSAYWPGFSLLLAPFMALGIPWACNPTLVALSVLLIGRLARDTVPVPHAAGWAMLFALASPAFLVNGMSYYAMPAHLLFNLAFAWLLLAPTPCRLFLAGAVGGFALILHNPFPHVVFALPWVLWLALRRGPRLRDLAWLGLGYLLVGGSLGVGWVMWQQSVLQAGLPAAPAVAVLASGGGAELSGLERGWRYLAGMFRVLQLPGEDIIYARLGGLAKLWLWASPLLLLLAWLGGRRQESNALRLLGASALLTFFAYFAIRFDQGHGWGYRYFHSAWGVLPVLAAAGVARLAAGPGENRRSVHLVLAALALFGLLAMNGLRFQQVGDFMAGHLAQRPPLRETGPQLVFQNGFGYYAADLVQNDPWLRGRTITFLSRDPAGEEAMARRFLPGGSEVAGNRFGRTRFAGP